MAGSIRGNQPLRPCAIALLFALVGCSPVTVRSAAPGADFSTRHTYAWEPNPQMGGTLDDSIAGQDIHVAVNQALEARGFQPADGQAPDFLVDYHVTLQRQTQIEGGGRWGWVSTYNYTEGTLIVALVDPSTKLFLWRGDTQAVVSPSGGAEQQNIQTAVQKMFANFPS
jgi:hypothetical protein